MNKFNLVSSFKPAGSQPEAIEKLVKGLNKNQRFQTLIGVTGSGKTFTMANVLSVIMIIISQRLMFPRQILTLIKNRLLMKKSI